MQVVIDCLYLFHTAVLYNQNQLRNWGSAGLVNDAGQKGDDGPALTSFLVFISALCFKCKTLNIK